MLIDTSFVRNDTSSIIDTTIVQGPVDSTARVKYFKYERKDGYNPLFGTYNHPLILYGSNQVERKILFDSLDNVLLSEYVNGQEVKYPVKIPFEKYLKTRRDLTTRYQFYKIIAENYKIETKDDLEKLFKDITDITIPLPFASETIFGPPTIKLTINGQIDITASYQRNTSEQQTYLNTDNAQNNINFKQDVSVTTKGSIGDKLTIDADWNSQRTFDFENQLKLKYKGYPDEVVQSIEAGNVSLETRSNLIGSTQALFGVKGQFKLGPLTLTAIASQKKSEKKEVNITGGATETPFTYAAYEYSDNHYFLDLNYRAAYEEFYNKGQIFSDSLRRLKVSPDIEVWVQTTPNNQNKRAAVGWVQLERKPQNGYSPYYYSKDTSIIAGKKYSGYFYKLNPNDFTLHPEAGYISLNINLQNDEAVGVAYKLEYPDQNNTLVQYGTYSSSDSLVLKLVKVPSLQSPTTQPAYTDAWNLKIRSIYDLKVKNIKNDATRFSLNVSYKPPSGEDQTVYPGGNITYMTRLRMDIRPSTKVFTENWNQPDPDQQFDFLPGYTIDLTGGYLIFPTLSPFYNTLISTGIPDTSGIIAPNKFIYTDTKIAAQSQSIKFYLTGKAIGDATDRYNLGFNLVEGSVKVFNGSSPLAEGVDFTVDYTTGELRIRNAGALSAGANLKITYETNDLFQLASKTMLGTRLEYAINKSSYIGFTMLNLKQQTLNDKIRIGEEPTNNTIMGFDATGDIKMNFFTNLVNKLPGYNTKEESKLTLNGEVAFMLPEPNTKKSKIPSDNNESVAYLDDFEGSKKVISLGMVPTSWSLASIPKDSLILNPGSVSSNFAYDSIMSFKRSSMQWYTVPNSVPVTDVYPNKKLGSNQNRNLSPLVLRLDPLSPGQFTYITRDNFQSFEPDPRKRWMGFFKYLNTSQTNLLDENMNFIEIWMQINPTNSLGNDSAKMMVDLGIISEKVIADTLVFDPDLKAKGITYHTEDKNQNGTLDIDEDVGLDGINDTREVAIFGPNGLNRGLGPDPSGDDYSWDPNSGKYDHFNGTEGNSQLDVGKKIDTEDLNGDGNLQSQNSYFEYEIPLIADTINNPYIIGGNGVKRWYQFSVPLSEYKRQFEGATFTNVQYVRIWFKGMTDTTYINIVDMNLVGNQWQKTNKQDTSFSISVVNIEDNSSIYDTPVQPPEILRQRDQSSTDANALLNEQSLSLELRNLVQGQGKFATKYFNTRPVDLLNYKIVKLFINGDPTFKYVDTNNYDASVVVRLGSDTLNYYEYKAPIHPDKRPGSPWETLNEISINLADLTLIKQLRDSTNLSRYYKVPNGPPGAKYGIVGNPTISNISIMQLGVVNNRDPLYAHPLTGSVWFNEMRVLKTDNKSGYAFTLGARLKVADLADLNFSYSKTDPHFHSLEGRFGSRVLSNSWEFSGTLNLHKILNSMLASLVSVKFKDFFTIPVSFAHSESFSQPRYLPNTDIDLETAVADKRRQILEQYANDPKKEEIADYLSEQVRISAQTLTIRNRISVNGFKFTFPGDNFIVKELLNKIETNLSWASSNERTPTAEIRNNWELRGDIGFNANLKLLDALHLNIGKLLPLGDEYKNAKLYFFLPFAPLAPLFSNNLSMALNVNRSHGDETLRNSTQASPVSRNFGADRRFSLDWKFIENWIIDLTGNYSFGAGSDLTFLETTNDSLRTQRSNGQIIDDIFFNHSLINFGKDISYSQTININPKFNIPVFKNFIDLTSSYRVQYAWIPTQSTVQGNTVGYVADFQTSAFIKLKSFFDLFKKKTPEKFEAGANTKYQQENPGLGDLLKLIGGFIPDQLNLTYSQNKTLSQPGVSGRPGFANFWMMASTKENYGPSRLYQLGWTNYPGKRLGNLAFTDKEGYGNSLTLSTFITPIFPNNLKINFTYKTGWSKISQLGYITNSAGDLGSPISTFSNRVVSRPIFLFTSVDKLIEKLISPPDTLDAITKSKQIAESFEKDIVSFPFPSWSLTLNGIEKFEMFSGFASAITFENAFSAEYSKNMKFNGIGSETIESQSITSGFSPLIGVNITFKPIGDGNLTASFKINKTTNYDLVPTTPVLNNTSTSDLSINATYTKQGFKIPLFGLSLQNDLSISFSYTRTKNDPRSMKLQPGAWWSNDALNGSISTTLNPAILYALSRSVSVQLFYKFTKIEPTEGSNQVITRSSNEAGLNVKLTIQ